MLKEIDKDAKQLQHEMVSEVLRSLQHFFSVKFHDIANPVAGIRENASYILTTESNLSELAKRNLKRIIKACSHIQETAANSGKMLREFMESDREKLEISVILEEAVRLTSDLQTHIRIETNGLSELPPIRGNRILLTEVFAELIRNAIDAIAGKKEGLVRISGNVKTGNLEIVVSDNGTGIEFDNVDKIFELGQTTKGKGHSGKGLFDIYLIVKAHRGTINVQSVKGVGTEFIIELPLFRDQIP